MPGLSAVSSLTVAWYDWGVFVGFLAALVAAFWVFYDSQQKDVPAVSWQVAAALGVLLTLPSLAFRLAPNLAFSAIGAVEPAAYLGMLGTAVAVVGAIAYVATGPQPPRYCERCGQPMQKNWTICPRCPAPTSEPVVTEPEKPTVQPAPVVGPTAVQRQPTIVGGMQRQAATNAWLIMQSEPRKGKEYPLLELTRIGRDGQGCEIVLDDANVSRLHASVRLEGGQYKIKDMDSANGTFVNGQRVESKVLVDGDVIKLGQVQFVFMRIAARPKPAR